MQLEKAKETKQDMERCRLLAQRIAEELAPATAAVLNAETPALEKALHRAGVDVNPFTVAARQADLLVVEDPAWVEMPAQLPGQVLLVFTGSNVAEAGPRNWPAGATTGISAGAAGAVPSSRLCTARSSLPPPR